jgi:hypothetical protein
MEVAAMFVAGDTIETSVAQSQAGLWMLVVFLIGLAAMAYLTVREASLYETRTAIRNLKRERRRLGKAQPRSRKPTIPQRERLSRLARVNIVFRAWMRGPDYREIFLPSPEAEFKNRLRAEIDKLVGKAVYHGQKEQL